MGLGSSLWVLGCPMGLWGAHGGLLWGCEGCPCRVSLWVSMACPYGSWGVPMGFGVFSVGLWVSLWVLGCPYGSWGVPMGLWGAHGELLWGCEGCPCRVSLWVSMACPYGSWGHPYGSWGVPMGFGVFSVGLGASLWVLGCPYGSWGVPMGL